MTLETQNLSVLSSHQSGEESLQSVDFMSGNDTLTATGGCAGSAGTLGSAGTVCGCAGTFGTLGSYGSYGSEAIEAI